MARTYLTGKRLAGAALAALSLLALAACDGNGNPPERATLRVDLAAVQRQLGVAGGSGGYSTMATGLPGSDAMSPVYSLVVGAIVITFTDQELTANTTLSDALMEALKTDAINSVAYLKIVALPTAEDAVEFDLPPANAGFWQVVALATRAPISTFDQLSQDSIGIYYGFDPHRRRTVTTSETVDLPMQRACLINIPPLGCAQYNTGRKSVVTSGVEIRGVSADGQAIASGSFPIIVRNVANTLFPCTANTPCSPYDAAITLDALAIGSATLVEVQTTHQQSLGQVPACSSDFTKCTTETFVTTF